MSARRVTIIGTGLIGASIGMALRDVGWFATGWDSSPEALQVALERGALDEAAGGEAESLSGADLVVLAGPPRATIEIVRRMTTTALVTDVTGVKIPVIEAAPASLRFVGGHPMAGREHAGPVAATPALFRGAAWILTEDRAAHSDLEEMTGIVESVGGVPYRMSATAHDRIVSSISHLPHLIAVALVNQVAGDPSVRDLAAGSFRDLTRVAASDPGFWPEVLIANRANVAEAMDGLIGELEAVRASLLERDAQDVETRLSSAQSLRRDLAPPIVSVRVLLQDKPGEIAAVGRALEDSSVDVRDLQLRHAIHGGGGVLTLAVRPGEAEPLRAALHAEGFQTE